MYFEELLREENRERDIGRSDTIFLLEIASVHNEGGEKRRSGTVEEREEKRNTHRRTHRVESSVTCLRTSPLGTLVECGVRQGGEAVKSIQCFCFK